MTTEGNTSNTINYLTLIIGWVLGLISTIGFDYYRKTIIRREVKKGILSELKELKLRMVGMNYMTTLKYLTVTKEWTDWIKAYYEYITESDEYDYKKNIHDTKYKKAILNNDEFYKSLLLSAAKFELMGK